MKTADFYYDLPQELIAQHPVEPRDSSRLMVMDRQSGALQHKIFRDVIEYLNVRTNSSRYSTASDRCPCPPTSPKS